MMQKRKDLTRIRDSIHGSITASAAEMQLISHPAFQRLRNIKQVGFADLAFPGATHSRYSHSLGAMHTATRLLDGILSYAQLKEPTRNFFVQATRLAVLFHDVGHPPLSHSTEMRLPKVSGLSLSGDFAPQQERKATHEDYTLKVILDTSLGQTLAQSPGLMGVSPFDVASLLKDGVPNARFMDGGLDYGPLLRQIVSSECDADRMDYLIRDSVYCGVNYGKFDSDWLINNLVPVERDNKVFLGIRSKAVFSFEDFLLSRYHMFASVYLHHTPIIYEKMLERHFEQNPDAFLLPSDVEAYLQLDDHTLWQHLRTNNCPYAKRIVQQNPYVLVDEYKMDQHTQGLSHLNHETVQAHLKEAGISAMAVQSKSLLSKYFKTPKNPMFVVTSTAEVPLESYTPLFARYEFPSEIFRLYVAPEHLDKARAILRINREAFG